MISSIKHSVQILERTPLTLQTLLSNIDEEWTQKNEGDKTWSPFDVIGHLVHCEETNWIPRINIMLSDNEIKKFEPLDRFAQFEKCKGKTTDQLLEDFINVRRSSLSKLERLKISEAQLAKTAIHPELGLVNLSQLISTWVVHDLDHLAQISRVMAKQYKNEVGPWIQYMRVLNTNI